MKTRWGWMVAMAGVALAGHAAAQDMEDDDMYFRAKDREKLNAQRVIASNTRVQRSLSEVNEEIAPINPTDSYSARGVNPEHLGNGSSAEPSYFRPGYQPASALATSPSFNNFNNFNGWNSGFNRWGMMPGMGFGMGMGPGMGWGNGFGSPWGWNDPFWGGGFSPGWSSSISFGWGNGWNNWGMPSSAFWGDPFMMNCWSCSPWGWNSFGGGWGWNNWGWNRPIIVVPGGGDSNGRGAVYGRRSSRSSDLNNPVTSGGRNQVNYVSRGTNSRSSSATGRSAGNDAGSYYQRGWRSNPSVGQGSGTDRSSWSAGNRSSSWGTGGDRSSWSNSRSGSSFERSSGSSFSSGSFGGGSRSSGGSSGGSSSGSRSSRGRD